MTITFQNEGGSSSWYRSRFFKNVHGMITDGREADFSKNVDGMKVAHTAGTKTEFSKNVHGMKVAHTAGTEKFLFKNVNCQTECPPSLFEADGAARRNARSD